MDRTEKTVFQLILYAGNAKSLAMEAISLAKERKLEEARQRLEEADREMSRAHQIQTAFIQQEAAGEKTEITMLMIHAQDHLMTSITVKELAAEFVDLYERLPVIRKSK
ncbi:PTS lactose/cellobiose transporter subunit IIA [Paenactinomyces guangxiensis]|uniref:PTS lactose/cellobiose transporter subunit IIA n=1 Tax=Paenactinomyces guangxiensis TaxID=1490290 RepID=A0A7W1WN42_9BACL|nr:PTS lactose/cellobiose transporter subunit IIA [Paenactinomyces guangxiensis]MBA4492885.1 PTS lactose/cellobiose transporter subunit IIA [Paenactinomyces guangxiensis]MBH8590267.1 PTS lactose/cellobiose transporter subunit IIA [Paenactinomyces guangxiensis]